MSKLECIIYNSPRSKISVRVETSSHLVSPITTRSKNGSNFTLPTLSIAKQLQEFQLNLNKFNHSKTRKTSQNFSLVKESLLNPRK